MRILRVLSAGQESLAQPDRAEVGPRQAGDRRTRPLAQRARRLADRVRYPVRRKPLPHYNDSAETRTTASWLVKDFFGYWFECPGGVRNTAHHDSVKLGAPGARLVKNALQCCICFALTEDLVHDACERRRGVDDDPVVRKGFFRVIHAHSDFPFLWCSAPISWGPAPLAQQSAGDWCPGRPQGQTRRQISRCIGRNSSNHHRRR